MNSVVSFDNSWSIGSFGIIAIIFALSLWFVIHYLKPHMGMALNAWLGALCFGGVVGIQRIGTVNHAGRRHGIPLEELVWFGSGVLLGLFLIPFILKLYQKWIYGELTEVEKKPGREGIRGWLTGGNLLCCLGISLCAWKGFDYSYWGVLMICLSVLLAYPLYNILSQNNTETMLRPVQSESPKDDLSAEREKVLTMLENGKITAAESAELLNALSETARQAYIKPESAYLFKSTQRLVLLGGLVLLVAFFMPWFSINPGKEVQRFTRQMQGALPEMAQPSGFSMPTQFDSFSLPLNNLNSINIRGGDIHYGLGWLVLLLGLVAPLLPFFASGMNPHTQQKSILVAIGVGSVILLFLFIDNLRHVNVGVVLAMISYGLIIVGTKRQQIKAL